MRYKNIFTKKLVTLIQDKDGYVNYRKDISTFSYDSNGNFVSEVKEFTRPSNYFHLFHKKIKG